MRVVSRSSSAPRSGERSSGRSSPLRVTCTMPSLAAAVAVAAASSSSRDAYAPGGGSGSTTMRSHGGGGMAHGGLI
eukprot:810896-Pleurochrysis_carterae.AAC.1